MNKLEFEDSGRTFTCEAATSRATPDQMWWWVNVSGDALRYAAFHKKAGDTATSLKPRIIAYYEKVLADRARPPLPRPTWGQGRPPNKPAPVQPD
ncbi:MAG TPA: hypothetical protein VIF32_02650 [Gemmatimonadaceae bacterium]|jgi:hypothetical protein